MNENVREKKLTLVIEAGISLGLGNSPLFLGLLQSRMPGGAGATTAGFCSGQGVRWG
jgi:hypothetical protein